MTKERSSSNASQSASTPTPTSTQTPNPNPTPNQSSVKSKGSSTGSVIEERSSSSDLFSENYQDQIESDDMMFQLSTQNINGQKVVIKNKKDPDKIMYQRQETNGRVRKKAFPIADAKKVFSAN